MALKALPEPLGMKICSFSLLAGHKSVEGNYNTQK